MELIDTLWNVNYHNSDIHLNGHQELIDTLWNVNQINLFFQKTNSRINRYIMECK